MLRDFIKASVTSEPLARSVVSQAVMVREGALIPELISWHAASTIAHGISSILKIPGHANPKTFTEFMKECKNPKYAKLRRFGPLAFIKLLTNGELRREYSKWLGSKKLLNSNTPYLSKYDMLVSQCSKLASRMIMEGRSLHEVRLALWKYVNEVFRKDPKLFEEVKKDVIGHVQLRVVLIRTLSYIGKFLPVRLARTIQLMLSNAFATLPLISPIARSLGMTTSALMEITEKSMHVPSWKDTDINYLNRYLGRDPALMELLKKQTTIHQTKQNMETGTGGSSLKELGNVGRDRNRLLSS